LPLLIRKGCTYFSKRSRTGSLGIRLAELLPRAVRHPKSTFG
jgi:hypothetical protein